jgi:hypothetical protein
MKAGDTFIPARFDHHLWIVLSDPKANPDNVVIVNFTTHTLDEEPHCIIQKGSLRKAQDGGSLSGWKVCHTPAVDGTR